jgi:hypothetical protein
MRQFKISCLFLLFWACVADFSPELEWEDVQADYEPELNILGILSGDSLVTSFVRVHRTLRVDEAANTLMRDTIFGNVVVYYASRFVVRDAEVTVSNGIKDYVFLFMKSVENDERENLYEAYVYNGEDLNPKPGEKWTLSVATPGGLSASGETVVPPSPELNKEQLPDSFNINQTMNITWAAQPDNYQLVNVSNYQTYFFYEKDKFEEGKIYDSCGFRQELLVSPGETVWTYRREICEGFVGIEDTNGGEAEDFLLINLMSMDSNYHNYFIKYGEDQEFASLFLGQGGSGRSYGIKGGLWLFCAIGIDRHWLPIGQ